MCGCPGSVVVCVEGFSYICSLKENITYDTGYSLSGINMNISYDLLRSYVETTLTPEEVAAALTSIGLEVGGVEEVESIPGGLKGLVIGHVLTCDVHENSDHLHVTTVDIGAEAPLQIVCGAPNVAAGKAVVVATIGTVLTSGDESFTIKKSKIRGVESFGMLCSEVEIGVGHDNSGIILLDTAEAKVGTPAAEYFGVTSDYVLEVDITPNRVDATSHYGVARDLAAYLTQQGTPTVAKLPEVLPVPATGKPCPVPVMVAVDETLCPRFEGLVIRGLKVTESPDWLRRQLETIGLRPINVVVDVTNYVLHEYGQPLHAYDLAKTGGALSVQLARQEKMLLLDKSEGQLTERDLVIASAQGTPLCVAGVMGGLESGTTETTTEIFLESANFNATSVRKTARRLGVNTDSSFRFERGLDPNRTTWALMRAASLILELCPGSYIDGDCFDHYPAPLQPYEVTLRPSHMDDLIGKSIPLDEAVRILESLEIEVVSREEDAWQLRVPRYRIDVTREADVIEEVMRIYGYNNIELSGYVHANLSPKGAVDRSYSRRILLSEQLTGAGFNELLNNSLSSEAYYEGLTSCPADKLVQLVNPLSGELNILRQTLLFGGLSAISRNLRRQQKSFYYYEWGNCYAAAPEVERSTATTLAGYRETQSLGLWVAGSRVQSSWAHADEATSPFELKAHILHLFERLGVSERSLRAEAIECDLFAGRAYRYATYDGKAIALLGQVSSTLLTKWDIDLPVYYAEINWDNLNRLSERVKVEITDLPKFPIVRRDLSLLLDEQITFAELAETARRAEKKLLRDVTLFDVYEGKNLPAGKKSYALSFYLQDTERTMSDKQIDAIMAKIRKSIEDTHGASLR